MCWTAVKLKSYFLFTQPHVLNSWFIFNLFLGGFFFFLVTMKIRLALNSQRSAYLSSQVLGLMAPPLSYSPARVPMVLLSYIDFWPGPASCSSVTGPWGGRTRGSEMKIEQVGSGVLHKLCLTPSKLLKKYSILHTVCREKWGRVSGKLSYNRTKSAGP